MVNLDNLTVLDERLARERAYWTEKLSGDFPLATFPLDFPRSGAAAERGTVPLAIEPAAARRLLEVCGGTDSLILAAWVAVVKILLHKYSGLEEIVVGTAIHRQHAEVASLNRTLALRDRLVGTATGREILLSVKQTLAEAYEHQKFPFLRLLELLGIERQRGIPALFSVLVLFDPINDRTHVRQVDADVLFLFDRTAEGLNGTLEFDARLLRRDTAEIVAKHFRHVLHWLLAASDKTLATLDLLDQGDRWRLLLDFNRTAAPFPGERTIHGLFEEQAERSPDADALVLGTEALTYRQLNERANRLARFLARAKGSVEEPVALLLPHSFDMVVAVLAVLKAGGAYIPLDPEHPKNRLQHVLADSGARLVLTTQGLADRLPTEATAVALDREGEAIAREEAGNPPPGLVGSEHPAYVIYTSGSTGLPKGVSIRHRALVGYIWWAAQVYLRGEPLDFPLYTSLTFDLTKTSLFVPLISGSRLLIYPPREGEYPLLELLAEDRVDVIKLTPSHLELIKERNNRGSRVRRLIVGGEALSTALARDIEASFGGGVEIFNEFGPTEATVGCMLHLFDRKVDERAFVPIGRPAANVQLYVLDRELGPVAENMLGELCIAGEGLATGYFGKPDLTAARFVPQLALAGERMYRSGDLVRWLPQGILDFVGRVDEQVKVRGHRIELNELRSAVNRHPDIRDSVVMVAREAQGPLLVAYYLARRPIEDRDLHRFLAQSLPGEIIPQVFVHLTRFPLTLNGKVNVKALPTLAQVRKRSRPGYAAPRTRAEAILAEIWSALLGVQVGIHDNFFQLGGDSIVGIRVVARANQAGLRLAPRQIFQFQTVAELAAAEAAPFESEQGAVIGPVPLSPIQRYFFESVAVDPQHYNQALLLAVSPAAGGEGGPQPVTPEACRRAVARLLDHHDALRLRFEPAEAGLRQWNSAPGGEPPFAWIDLSSLPEPSAKAALERAAEGLQASLDLRRGPVVRVAYFGLGAQARLLIVIHHLVVDGVSWRILLEDFESALAIEAPFPSKTTPFKTWAERLVEHASSQALAAECSYWLDRPGPAPRLPVDHSGGLNSVASAREVHVSLEEAETLVLLRAVPEAFHTQVNDALLAAMVEACAGWTGRRRLLLALEGHGREEIAADLDLSRTVGWFTTVFPVQLDLEREIGPERALKAVQEQLRRIPRRGLGYGVLRYLWAGGEKAERLKELPEPELSFNYLGRFDGALGEKSPFRPAAESHGATRSARQMRRYLLEVNGLVGDGRLQLSFAYSENLHRRDTIEALAALFVERLRHLIERCPAPGAGGRSAADFPLAQLDPGSLERLLAGRQVEDVYPLSPLQQGLLFHSVGAPGGGVYFRQLSCTLAGDLDLEAFKRAAQHAVDRHSILRTAFAWRGLREPLQVVLRQARLAVEVEDWRTLPAPQRRERLRRFRLADRERGFALETAPLMRLALLREGERAHRLVWSFHHLVSDGWSFPLLISEVFAAYECFRLDLPLVQEEPRPFRDYIAWLRRQDLGAAELFWRRKMAGFAAATPLPTDRQPRPGQAEPHEEAGDLMELLPAAATAALQSWARARKLTLNTVLQGAWALLLSRYGGERDVVFGAVTAGRPAVLPGIESMLGVFINTLPVRVDVRPEAALDHWLHDLQDEQAEAREYDYSPLAQVQLWSDVAAGQPLFNALMVFENYPLDSSLRHSSPSLSIEDFDFPETNNYPLSLVMGPGAELPVRLIYDRGRFDRTTIARQLRHFLALLESFAGPGEPGLRLSQLPLLWGAERHQILHEWSGAGGLASSPSERDSIHRRFEAQADRAPDAVAVDFDGQALTYRELDVRANRLAHHLRALGADTEILVGLCAERSVEMVVALVGILKSGAAYVPLDPGYPAQRLAFLMNDTVMPVLVGVERLVENLPVTGLTQTVLLDADAARIARGSAARPAAACLPENLAYVMYTSGSTGEPKGVEVPHRGVIRLVQEAGYVDFGPREVFLQLAPLAFDASTFEIWGALLHGGRLVVAAPAAGSLAEIGRSLVRHGVTTLWLTAGLFREMVEANLAGLAPVRQLLAGGDVISPLHVRRVLAEHPGCRVINGYGPTEGTTFTCCHSLAAGEEIGAAVPLGRPIAGTSVQLLGAQGEPVPLGAAGELAAGGSGLARGYLRRPELTAERWIPDAASGRRGERLYRTGDLARHLADGRLEFLGRLDHQFKVQGFRVEAGEVEAALAAHPAIRDSVVVVREDRPGDRRLVAYLVVRDVPGFESGTAAGRALRSFLGEHLPEPMVPALFVVVDKLPLTPNGKVDRRALPAPGDEGAGADGYVAPRGLLEAELVALWSQILGREGLGVQDDFFELGGHSLLAIRLVSQMRDRFGVELPLRRLFEEPTVASLAGWLRGGGAAGVVPSRIRPVPRGAGGRDEFPLSFAQRRLWFLDRLAPQSAAYNVPLAVRLAGPLDVAVLAASLGEVLGRHEALRTTFGLAADGEAVQRVAPPGDFRLPLVELAGIPGGSEAEMRRLVAQDARRPFDLERGPLFRPLLLRLAADDHVLLATMHHIVSDGWSLAILVRELVALYEAFAAGQASPLPGLEVQYADYAVWQRRELSGEALEAELRWWRGRLEGLPALLELPTDRPRPTVQTLRGASRPLLLEAGLAARLHALGRQKGATLFMVLLTAYEALLGRYAGQEDFGVGTPVAGRDRLETEGLIGFFVNTLTLRADLGGAPTVRQLLERVQRTTLEVYAHQQLPFEKLVEELRPERSLAFPPLFQAVFVFQGSMHESFELPGLALKPMELGETRTAKFDLSLAFAETAASLPGALEYNTDLFDGAWIERFVRHLQSALEAFVAAPDGAVADLPLVAAEESHQIVLEWNPGVAGVAREGMVHELFEGRAGVQPDAVAASYLEMHLSYGELDERANQVAHRLARLGVGPEIRVGVCMERSPEMLAALLGVLKAGGAYLPLDPTYPRERLAFMVEDGHVAVLIGQAHLLGWQAGHRLPVLLLDRSWGEVTGEPRSHPRSRVEPDGLAYVMYTSGSTGRPKGVCIEHRALQWLVATLGYVDPRPADRFAQGSTHTFDAATFELWGALTQGARLVGIPKEVMISPRDLAARLAEEAVTVLYLTAALFVQTASEAPAAFRGLRRLLVGGEVVDASFFRRVLESAAPRRLLYLYGPTETTVFSTWYEVDSPPGEGRVSVGRPIEAAPHYPLDAGLRPVPPGIFGEVYIGGGGLARGYLDRPELTAQRFVPHPFADLLGAPGARLYRSGDRMRHLPDGRLEFASRIDDQVKIRGFRVEPREIETVLLRHPQVREALVVLREDRPGDKRLVAYLVPREGGAPSSGELRDLLRQTLPEYMVPAAFVPLAALPLFVHGKVDRGALPPPAAVEGEAGEAFVAPRTATEELLAGIWEDLLQVDRLGVHDDFFESGGHSLLATRLISRVREVFRLEIPLRALFEQPTVAALAKVVDEESRSASFEILPAVERVGREGSLPLSFAQQRLWFLDHLVPDNPFYNVDSAVRLTGPLDLAALRRAFAELVERHEVLRTTFHSEAGQPVQVIGSASFPAVPVVDLGALAGALPEDARQALLERLAQEESGRPFDLSRGPVLRALLLRLGNDEHVLLATVHHIACDAWSLDILWREMMQLYDAFRQGLASPLAPLSLQYADYAAWQRRWLQGDVLKAQLSYWRQRLDGVAVLELPTDRPRPAVQAFRGGHEPLSFPGVDLKALRALARQESATPFMILLALFQGLLARYSGQAEVSVGTPISGRNRIEVENLIGFFLNTLVIRVDLTGEVSFLELLRRVRRVTLEAYANQDLPFEKLVDELRPTRSLSHSPLFQVTFVLLHRNPGQPRGFGLQASSLSLTPGTAKFDLTWSTALDADGISGLLEYDTALFDRTTVLRLGGHLQSLMAAVASDRLADRERRLSELPLLSAAERAHLLEWNDTRRSFSPEGCLHERFGEQARRAPDRAAVIWRDTVLSYGELEQRGNQLAHELRGLGIGPEARVGLLLGRSPAMIVGMLGTLKAGGAYVPLDTSYPAQRLAFTLEDARLAAVLTEPGASLPGAVGAATVLDLDGDWARISRQSGQAPAPGASAENLAYVIYTSGSSGWPKGVMVPHRGVCNLLAAHGLEADDAVLQIASSGFDFSVWECFAPLWAGARVVLAEPGRQGDAPYLVRAVQEYGITAIHFVPSMLAVFLDEDGVEHCASLRQVFAGGEALTPELRDRALACLPATLMNQYGPTEASIDTTRWVCAAGQDPRRVPIGYPIANSRLQVMDRELRPLPGGIDGELLVGGAGLARGYLGRPDLTAERFVPDPLAEGAGLRLYRTGDRARRLADGALEFRGRLDQQIKLRGFRIELGEIETSLLQYPLVRNAVVLVREDIPGDRRLVAYIVAQEGSSPSPAQLRRFLQTLLPEPMIPSFFVPLAALPLTPSGKLDRAALPAPAGARPQSLTALVAPRTPVEEVLALVWADLLRLDRLGVHDNFFELGGHSLLATQLISRVREVFSIEMPLRALFERPTVAALAEAVEEERRAGSREVLPPIEPASRDGDLPLSFAQQRLWMLDRLEPESSAYNIPVALRVEGGLRIEFLRQSLAQIVRRHEVLRTRFVAIGETVAQVIEPPAARFPLPVVDLAALDGERRESVGRSLVRQESARPFDLYRGPLLRAAVVRLAERDHLTLLTMHHIVSDGWSMELLVREVGTLYEALSGGGAEPLPDLPVQYADYAVWQRGWLAGGALERELDYWRGQLAGAPPLLELPTDRPRPAVRRARGSVQALHLPAALADRLRTLSRRQGSTLFMTFLAGFQALLGLVTNQRDFVVGTPIAGRNHLAIESLIGFFVNMLCLRTKLSDELTFVDLIGRARETVLAASANQNVPFEKLVEELEPERSFAHSPLFQVAFALQNAPRAELSVEALRLYTLETPSQTAKFDLTLAVVETATGLAGSIEYGTDLFDATTVIRLAQRFRHLLAQVAEHPELALSAQALLAEEERHQILLEWSGGGEAPPPDLPLHSLFEAQAVRRPDEPALVWDGGTLTYAELDRRADGLSHHLRLLGVGPEVPVAFCLERSPEMVVTTLAILKAGGAYVPLDPGAPAERLAFILGDVAAPVLVTSRTLRGKVPESGAQVVLLEDLPRADALARLPGGTGGDGLAYVMYTSGSTGQPKGVAAVHRAVVRLIRGEFARFGPDQTWSQVAPVSFDAATLEIWGALLHGGRLALLADLPEPRALGEAVARLGVTTLWLTTALLHQMVEENLAALAPLSRVLSGGEVMSPDHVRRVLSAHPDLTLVIAYGPTENTTFTTCDPLTGEDEVGWTVALGRPISHTWVRVLDDGLAPVPLGGAGELYAGGEGLARGYLGRPDLTAERFVPDPFGKPGTRLYRTGDRARWLVDGRLDFLGRVDRQVKIRGFRVEPGEVEAVLGRHPAVREAAVVVREDRPGDRRLVAFVAPVVESLGLAAELLNHLRRLLPPYMVPATLGVMAELPQNANGKVDRQALLAMREELPQSGGPLEGFLTATEALMTEIWAEVLEREQVGVEANFFDLGGHSLLAMRVISRVRKVFEVELPTRSVFEDDTVRALAARVDDLRRAALGVHLPPITAADRTGPIPLSFAQQRLWFLDQLVPSSSTYNVPVALRLSGRLPFIGLGASLTEVVRRHEILRTTFHPAAAGTVQDIAPAAAHCVPLADLRGLTPADRDAEAKRLMVTEAQRPFDLRRGPLLRSALLRLEDERSVALLTLHHIVSDGWSLGVLGREISLLEEAFGQGRPSPLPELPIQYADFSLWQRRVFSEGALAVEVEYWREHLRGAPPVADLPLDRPRPLDLIEAGGSRGRALPAGLSAALRAFGRRQGATPFMTLLAGLQALLGRYAKEPDITVGTLVAGRSQLEIEGLIGFFVNTLVLRTRMEDDPGFETLLQRVRQITLDAHGHQDVPFEELVEKLQPERSLAVSPLFQVMFDVKTTDPGRGWGLQGLEATMAEVSSPTAKFDLNLSAVSAPQGFALALEYRTRLFDATTIERLLEHLEQLLAGAVADPLRRLSELAVLSGPERHQLLIEWGGTEAGDGESEPAAGDFSLYGLFAQQAGRSPDRIAVVSEGEQLGCGELAQRAQSLGVRLRSLGVRPDDVVGLSLERSSALLVGALGVLAAGCAYLSLDPALPESRQAWMVEDSAATVVVTDRELPAEVFGYGVRQVRWAFGEPAAAGEAPAVEVRAGHAAYVIYTSGSTGQPKGVVVSHGNVVRLLRSAREWFGFDAADVWSLFHSYGFDFSVWETWGALLHGGRLVVVPYWVSRSPEAFAELLRAEQVTVLNQTPTTFGQLAQAATVPIASLRWVIFGGETLRLESLVPWWTLHGEERPRLVNMYGITETTVVVTHRPLSRADLADEGRSWIGGPLEGQSVWVLDAHQQPVAIGVAGELFVGGSGLARGYLKRPDLTAQRFVPHPFGEPGARLYRSGDLVRRHGSGDLEYLGRIDTQVKIRGFRIELGEIEAALEEYPLVRSAVVTVREDVPGDRRLVAYLVAEDDCSPTPAELRGFLQELLPEHMVPSSFVQMAALPLSSSGKVDRRALPAPERALVTQSSALFVAPRTPVEELLTLIWAELLQTDRLGVHDNFFELGGHSLLATQVVSRVRSLLEVEVPLRAVFERPTLAGFAYVVEAARRNLGGRQMPPIEPVGRDQELPLSFAQQRLWFIDQLEPESPLYNIPMRLAAHGQLSGIALEQALREVVRRHEVLRTVFRTVEGRPVQVISADAELAGPVVDLARLLPGDREREAERLMEEDARRPFSLGLGPLLRLSLLRLGGLDHRILFDMHHIASDGWSFQVLMGEVSALYEAYRQGLPSPLPELPIQYADYAVWQRRWLDGETLQNELRFWKDSLSGLEPLQLPTDRPRSRHLEHAGAVVAARLPREIAERVPRLARDEKVTLFMALLAAFQALLGRYGDQEDLAVGTPIAGRNHQEVEPLIGFFVNLLVLRIDLSGQPTFPELLVRVRQQMLLAYAHQELPFERLVELLEPDRDGGGPPLFQALFNLSRQSGQPGEPGVPLELPELTLRPQAGDSGLAKFDLTLSVKELEGDLFVGFEYDRDLFDQATITRLAGHFASLLGSWVESPGIRFGQIPLLSPAEHHQMLVEWPAPVPAPAGGASLYQLFSAQAERTPAAVALVDAAGASLTYADLRARATGLAGRLRRCGVGPEVVVGLCSPRTPAMVVGLLAILQAGGAYLPLEPSLPAERLVSLLEDSRAAVLLLSPSLQGMGAQLPAGGPEIVWLDVDEACAPGAGDPGGAALPESLAYLIYTSGSTGRPKAVAIEHRSAIALVGWARETFSDAELAGVLFSASISFDISVFELFVPLSRGGRVILVENTLALPALAPDLDVRFVTVVPSVLAELLRRGGLPDSVRTLAMAGETLPRALAEQVIALGGDRRLLNLYGPSETTTYSTLAPVVAGQGPLPIGRPILGTTAYVLAAAGATEPVPTGVPGELHLGGKGLARGYLGRPELTAERFVPDPFAAEAGGRLYRTGDRARWLSDGPLMLLGRLDFQVKVRGFRIELGEVEAALLRQPGVRQAAVLSQPAGDGSADLMLVAYVVGEAKPGVALRDALSASLPSYMVPALFVELPELPQTRTGKIDRRALAALGQESRTKRQGVGPRDLLELELTRIWQEALGLPFVGVDDDFFALGGHSILAVRLMAGIECELGRRLPVTTLFETRTIEGLARLLRRQEPPAPSRSLTAIRPLGALPPLVLVHPGGGGVLCYARLAHYLGADQPVLALQARGLDGGAPPRDDIPAMAAAYLEELRTLKPEGPYRLGGWSLGGLIAFEMARQLRLEGRELLPLLLLDTRLPDPGLAPERLDARQLLAGLALQLGVDPGDLAMAQGELQDLAAEAQLQPLLDRAHEGRFLPEDFTLTDLRHSYEVFVANLRAAARYQPGPFEGRVVVCRASDAPAGLAGFDPGSWRPFAGSGLAVVDVPGDHYSMLRDPHVERLVARLSEAELL